MNKEQEDLEKILGPQTYLTGKEYRFEILS